MHTPVKRSNGAGIARVQRQAQVLTLLYDEAFPEDGARRTNEGKWNGWLTTGQIAERCEMTLSPHFRQLVYEMAEFGWIEGAMDNYRNTMNVYYWKFREGTRFNAQWIGVFDVYLNEHYAEQLENQAL